jgi:WD40 repeat protein
MQMVPSSVLLPNNRLEHLLRQSLRYQQIESLFPFTKSTNLNLAEDMLFDPTKLPHLGIELNYHTDEVWVCKFSPSGKWLATAGHSRLLDTFTLDVPSRY